MGRVINLFGSFAPYLISFLFGAAITYWQADNLLLSPADSHATQEVSFEVEKGATPRSIADKLAQNKLIRSKWSIRLIDWARRKSADPANPPQVQFGEYMFAASLAPSQILDKLYKGDRVFHEVTIPEGTRVSELPALLEKTTLVSAAEVEAVLSDPGMLAKLSVPSSSFEGYVFPSTYKFTRPDNAEDMISRMVNEWRNHVTPDMAERMAALNMTPLQVVTLASIIEKETSVSAERELISSVFHNRLKLQMPLQTDPTVIYGIANFDGNLTREHLNTPGPYNTYLNAGLPPTPICNPGVESIKAALYPAETDYVFFVAKGDGTHAFSTTYKEHKANVEQYQKKR